MPFRQPDLHRIAHQIGNVARQDRRIVMETLAAQDPSGVCPPRAFARRVRIALPIRVLVVDSMGRDPENWTAFERQRSAPREEVLHWLIGLVSAMGQQAVIPHANAEHAGDAVEDEPGEDRAGVEEEERKRRADMKAEHRGRGQDVQAFLMLPSVHQRQGWPPGRRTAESSRMSEDDSRRPGPATVILLYRAPMAGATLQR